MRRKTGHLYAVGYSGNAKLPMLHFVGWVPQEDLDDEFAAACAQEGMDGYVPFEKGIEVDKDRARLAKHIQRGNSLANFALARPVKVVVFQVEDAPGAEA